MSQPKQTLFLRVPQRIFSLMALWCADDQGALSRNETCTGEPESVTCPRCLKVMRETLVQLTAWDKAVKGKTT